MFDPFGVQGLPPLVEREYDSTIIYDWFNLLRSGPVDITKLDSDDEFINNIILYPSERMDGTYPTVRDLVAISHVPHDQVDIFEHSQTVAQFKILEMLKNAGVRGRANGNHPKKPGEKVYLKPRLEPTKREIRERIKYKFEFDSRFEMCYNNASEIAAMYANDLVDINKRLMLHESRRYNKTYALW